MSFKNNNIFYSNLNVKKIIQKYIKIQFLKIKIAFKLFIHLNKPKENLVSSHPSV